MIVFQEVGCMDADTMTPNDGEPEVPSRGEPEILYQWSARKLTLVTPLYVAAVFAVFMLLAYFVFHSMTGVKGLALAAVGFVLPLLAEVSKRLEYRLTTTELERRSLNLKEPSEFKPVFQVSELSHVVSMREGFKFYKHLDEANPLRRFWKNHISDAYSGEVRVDRADQERVLEMVAQRGIPIR